MSLLSISQVLRLDSKTLLENLYSMVNDHDLDTDHTTLSYQADGDYVVVNIRARALTDQMQPGRYMNETSVRYRRESLQTLFNGRPVFFFPSEWPVTWGSIKAHLLGAYGVLIENVDVLVPGSETQTLTDAHQFQESTYVPFDHTIELAIAEHSPRFIPKVRGGDSLYIRIVSTTGSDLALIGPTKQLPPVTSLDA